MSFTVQKKQLYKNKYSLQEREKKKKTLLHSLITLKSPYGPERASCPVLPRRPGRRGTHSGSMTVEAALVLPLFLFAMVNMLSLIVMFQTYGDQLAQLHQTGRQLSMLAYGQTAGGPDIRLVKTQTVRPVIPVAAFRGGNIVNGCVMHKWNGYDISGSEAGGGTQKEELVYVTKSGAAYHRDRGCRYLNPSVRTVSRGEALKDGGYTACGVCGGSGAMVYVTDGGKRFHSTITCGGLKRVIDSVTITEALEMGRHPCPVCGG